MIDVNIYDYILVTLLAEIHSKYQSCMLQANAYNKPSGVIGLHKGPSGVVGLIKGPLGL